MSESAIKIGLDKRDKLIYAARVKTDKTRNEVKALIRLNSETPIEHRLLDDGDLIFAIADNEMMIKEIRLPEDNHYDKIERARFEMIQSLLENETNFYFNAVETVSNNKLIGSILRKDCIELILEKFNTTLIDKTRLGNFRSRAIALGKGFTSFCHQETGELICLADICDRVISICLIYRKKILSIAHIEISKFNLKADSDLEKIASEFKTIINFKLSSLFNDGVTVPISSLLVIGGSDILHKKLSAYFSLKIGSPKINHGFFSDPSKLEQIPIHNYLIALGLCVE